MLRQNNLDQQEKAFLHTHAQMLLYKCLRSKRMLNSHASLFYPMTDTKQIIIEIEAQKTCEKETVKKEDIKLKLQTPVEDITLKEERLAQTTNQIDAVKDTDNAIQ